MIDRLYLDISKIVIVDFSIENKLKRVKLFQITL